MADTRKISGISYPTDPKTILHDSELKGLFRAFAKKIYIEESIAFIEAVESRFDPKVLYKAFISDDAKMQINIPGSIKLPADALAKRAATDPEVWKDRAWRGIIEDAWDNVYQLLSSDSVPRFYASKEFRDHHEAALRKKLTGVDKAAKLLGVKDVKALTELTFQMRLDGADSPKAKALSEKLIKQENLRMKADAMIAGLKKAGFI